MAVRPSLLILFPQPLRTRIYGIDSNPQLIGIQLIGMPVPQLIRLGFTGRVADTSHVPQRLCCWSHKRKCPAHRQRDWLRKL